MELGGVRNPTSDLDDSPAFSSDPLGPEADGYRSPIERLPSPIARPSGSFSPLTPGRGRDTTNVVGEGSTPSSGTRLFARAAVWEPARTPNPRARGSIPWRPATQRPAARGERLISASAKVRLLPLRPRSWRCSSMVEQRTAPQGHTRPSTPRPVTGPAEGWLSSLRRLGVRIPPISANPTGCSSTGEHPADNREIKVRSFAAGQREKRHGGHGVKARTGVCETPGPGFESR